MVRNVSNHLKRAFIIPEIHNIRKNDNSTEETKKVLLVEDEKLIRTATGLIVREIGYEVDTSMNGPQAIAKFENYLDYGGYDVVIIDLMLQGEPEGHYIFKRMTELDPGVKGILSTSYSGTEVVRNYKNYGFSAVLKKPYSIDDLEAALEEVITGKKS